MDQIKVDLLAWLRAREDLTDLVVSRNDDDALLITATTTDGTPVSAAIAINMPL